MTVEELLARFPEIPRDLRDEPALAEFAAVCGPLLAQARKPSNCAVSYDAANHYYLKLIVPLGIYGYGLASREETLAELTTLAARARADLQAFAASLLPADVAAREVHGPGCG
ncbi:MAG TPA: hypothetical protein VKZ60_17305 [Chloroflexota bacterium]|jgi:hypothetical protein|nr:hypothetical protein [Chloroflexota bacterium]